MRTLFVLLLSVSLLSPELSAQTNNKKKDPGKNDSEAKKLFEEAEAHYQIQEYATALELYKKSYLLSLQPGLLFNIGQCQRQLKMYEEAIKSYKNYLTQSPDSPVKDRVEELIREAEKKLEGTQVFIPKEPSTQPTSKPTSMATSTPTSTPTSAPVSGVIDGNPNPVARFVPQKPAETPSASPAPFVYGAAALSGALGIGTGILYLSARSNVQTSLAQNDITRAEETAFFTQRAKTFGTLSNAFVGVGVASAIVGVILSKKHKETTLQVTPTGATMTTSF